MPEDPRHGDVRPGTGGCRKTRFAGKGKGKRGGYRTVQYYVANEVPVQLVAMINKGERSDLSMSEQNELKKAMASYAEEYRAGVRKKSATLKR